MWYFVAGFIGACVGHLVSLIWPRLRQRLDYWRCERRALPDGTRVHLLGYGFLPDQVWTTQWSMRDDADGSGRQPDDYRLTREGDGATTFARRSALVVVDDRQIAKAVKP